MRVPVSWLRDYVAIEMPLERARRAALGRLRRGRGDRAARAAAGRGRTRSCFRVGRVLEVEAHPNADRLRVVRVDLGEGEPRSIVCGAWNFEAGATVAVALPGARARGRAAARAARGARRALRRDDPRRGRARPRRRPQRDHAAPGGAARARRSRELLTLSDAVLVVEATGNRPDLQSVYGLAREIAALYGLPLAPAPGRDARPYQPRRARSRSRSTTSRAARATSAGSSRASRVGPSPQWLRARLHAAGVRSISNVVDVTNYVMLALGSPLHAFDFATLQGGRIVVRRAGAGERLTTLDGVARDARRATTSSSPTPSARSRSPGSWAARRPRSAPRPRTVLLEAANFEPERRSSASSERHRLRSEASGRWEKGVDPQLAGAAAELATGMLLELAGGRLSAAADVHAQLPERPVVRFRPGGGGRADRRSTTPPEQPVRAARRARLRAPRA